MGGLILGRQLSAGRALIKLTQEALAHVAGLHVNSIRYLERQERITTGFSRERVEQAMRRFGVIFFRDPSPGVRLCPNEKEFVIGETRKLVEQHWGDIEALGTAITR
jgi:transcriptional regulator with XRE-family HTH domain